METPTVDLADLRFDELSGATVLVTPGRQARPNLPARRLPVLRRRAGGARALRRPGRSPTGGRRYARRAGPRSCSTRPTTTPACGSSGATGVARVVDLWAERTEALGAPRRRRLRAGVREPRRRGRRHHRPPPRPGLRARRRGRRPPLARAAPGGPRRLRAVPAAADASWSSPRTTGGRPGCRTPAPTLTACCSHPTSTARTCPRSTARSATASPPCWSTCSAGSTGSSTRRCPTCLDPPAPDRRRPTGPRPTCTSTSSRRCARPACMRYVAAGELGSGLFLNPVRPEDAAAALRAAVPPPVARPAPGRA